MAYSRARTRSAAEFNLVAFIQAHPTCYYWTFTVQRNVTEKSEVEKMVKPLWDLLKRHGASRWGVWEKQERGAWHLHMMTDKYFDVSWLRPWMVERGWGPQMFVKRIQARGRPNGEGWEVDVRDQLGLIRYLMKYVTKDLSTDKGDRIKPVCSDNASRRSTVRFDFAPWVNPLAYLYRMGRQAFFAMHGELPTGRHDGIRDWHKSWAYLVRLGAEWVDWFDTDPWFISP